ncbi:MAG: hypothetical protein Q9181_000859 [Wetmoreana brouardii]
MQSQIPRSTTRPSPFQSSHSRWLALTHRVPSSHSSFFYGVISTKIYCRPTCSARLARRANVVFYDTKDQARRDGFRPCKRCEPDNTAFVGEVKELVARTIALLRIKKDDSTMKGSLKELAKEVGVTPSYLCRVFKKEMGVTVGAYMREFEREVNEGEAESSVGSLSRVGSGVVDVGNGILTLKTTARSPSVPVERRKGGPAEEDVGNVEQALDLDIRNNGEALDLNRGNSGEALDMDLDFDEWFWTKDFSNDSIYGQAI